MSRMTKWDYGSVGSIERLQEAGIALADADTEDDADYNALSQRLKNAAVSYVLGASVIRRVVQRRSGELSVVLRIRPDTGLGMLIRALPEFKDTKPNMTQEPDQTGSR